MDAPIGHFDDARPAPDCLDELTRPVADAVRQWGGSVPADHGLGEHRYSGCGLGEHRYSGWR
ncbi:hypothetical protein [Streptomyces sp. NPDC059894]|uniref:hypothetical protein n=1 Tax=unclassified Streptomyces TaxID=2593676 RepID=UPI003652EA3A